MRRGPVSILVFVELALGGQEDPPLLLREVVSILVFVELALGGLCVVRAAT